MQDPVVPIGSQSMLLSLQNQTGIVSWAEFAGHLTKLPSDEQHIVQASFEYIQSVGSAAQCQQTGLLLAGLQADSASIAAGLLLPLAEAGLLPATEIEPISGSAAAELITRLIPDRFQPKRTGAGLELLRHRVQTMSYDLRIIVIALANQLSALQTLKAGQQKPALLRLTLQTADQYCQLARLLSLRTMHYALQWQLLRLGQPAAYQAAQTAMTAYSRRAQLILPLLEPAFATDELSPVQLQILPPSPQQLSLSGNIGISVGICCNTTADCYQTLSRLHSGFRQVPGSFCDAITQPDYDGSRSLQTTVLLKDGTAVRCCIGTPDMLQFCECGVATLCFETEIVGLPDYFPWLERAERLADNRSAQSFVQSLQTDIFADQIVISGPGDLAMYVPATATVLDAAYQYLGEQASYVSAFIADGKPISADTALAAGMQLEFVQSTSRQLKRHWLSYANTRLAQTEIRSVLGRPSAAKRIAIGRKLLQSLMHQHSRGFLEEYDEAALQPAIETLGGTSLDDILLQTADGMIDAEEAYATLFEPEAEAFAPEPWRISCQLPADDTARQHAVMHLCSRYQIPLADIRFLRRRRQPSQQLVLQASVSYPQQQLFCKQLADAGVTGITVRKKIRHLPAVIAAAVAMIVLWAMNPFVIKALFSQGATPIGMTVIRAWSVAACTAVMLAVNKQNRRFISVSVHHPSLWIAGLAAALVNLCTNLTLVSGSPLLYSTILRANAVLLTIPFFMRKRQFSGGLAVWLLAVVAFALIAVSPEPPLAIVFGFAAVSAFVIYTAATHRFQQVARVSARYQQFLFLSSLTAAVALLPFLLLQPQAMPSLSLGLLIALYSAIFVVAPYTLYYAIMHRLQYAPTLSDWIHTVVLVTLAGQILVYGWQGTIVLSAAAILLVAGSMTAARLSAGSTRPE